MLISSANIQIEGIKDILCDYILEAKNSEMIINETFLNEFSNVFNPESSEIILDNFIIIISHYFSLSLGGVLSIAYPLVSLVSHSFEKFIFSQNEIDSLIIQLKDLLSGVYLHGGGDAGLIKELASYYTTGEAFGLATLENAVESHSMGFSAEQSRKNGGKFVEIKHED